MEEQQDPMFQPGEGLQVFAWIFWLAAIALLIWALVSPTAVPVSETDSILARIDPSAHPLPNPVNNIGLMQTKLIIFLGAGFTATIGAIFYGCGAIMKRIPKGGEIPSARPKYDAPSDPKD